MSQRDLSLSGECVILGSGPSVLTLSEDERRYLNEHPGTIAMNKFFLFHEMVRVVPKTVFAADFHYPSHRTVLQLVRKVRRAQSVPQLYLERYYENLFFRPLRHPSWSLRERSRLLRRHRFLAPMLRPFPGVRFFRHQFGVHEGWRWSESLDEPLFWRHGSLSTAINLATIVHPCRVIKLVGVDMKGAAPFYDRELQRSPELMDHTYVKARRAGKHWTAMIGTDGMEFFRVLATIRQRLEARGIRLVACHPQSAVVETGTCPFRPLQERIA